MCPQNRPLKPSMQTPSANKHAEDFRKRVSAFGRDGREDIA
jgi:hypothetical protein